MDVRAGGISFVCQVDGPEGAPWPTFSNSLNSNFSLWDGQVALLADRLHEIDLPTLLICGTQDIGTPPEGMREMASRIANARYVEIDPAGHLSNIENPHPFNAALSEFLDAAPR